MLLDQRPATVPMARGRGALRLPLLAAGAAAAGVTLLAVVDPNQPGHYPTCPFLALTGLYCPGCGSLRAIHDLAHGDLAGAMARNPLTIFALAGLLVAYAAWARRLWRGDPRRWVAPPWLIYAMFGVIVVFGVLRNLPGWTWLSPA
jgi:hypothetical protein